MKWLKKFAKYLQCQKINFGRQFQVFEKVTTSDSKNNHQNNHNSHKPRNSIPFQYILIQFNTRTATSVILYNQSEIKRTESVQIYFCSQL